MPQNAQEATLAFWEQTAITDLPSTWDTDGDVVEFLAIEPNWAGLKRGTVEDRNVRRRALATRQKLMGLRNDASASFGVYATGSGATTTASSAATTFALAELLRNAWGGQHLGYASAVVTPSATAPDITVGQGTNHPAGAPIFGLGASGIGQFLIVDSVSTDVLTLRTTADEAVSTVGAAIGAFPHTRAMFDRSHASHITHAFYFRGEDTEDNAEGVGCKINVTSLENSEAGGDASFSLEVICASYNSGDTVVRRALTGTPQGPTAPIVGRTGTSVRIADLGTAAMPDVGAYSFKFTPGIVNKRVPGVIAGGVQGFNAGGANDGTMIEITVPYDAAWITDFHAQQLSHIMVQVGYQRGDAWGLYLPRVELAENPELGVSADERAITLKFRALEYVGTTHTDGTDNYELERAKFMFLMAA